MKTLKKSTPGRNYGSKEGQEDYTTSTGPFIFEMKFYINFFSIGMNVRVHSVHVHVFMLGLKGFG